MFMLQLSQQQLVLQLQLVVLLLELMAVLLELMVLLMQLVMRQAEGLLQLQVLLLLLLVPPLQDVRPLSGRIDLFLHPQHRKELLLGLDPDEGEGGGCVHVCRVRGRRRMAGLTVGVLEVAENEAASIQLCRLEDVLDELNSHTATEERLKG